LLIVVVSTSGSLDALIKRIDQRLVKRIATSWFPEIRALAPSNAA